MSQEAEEEVAPERSEGVRNLDSGPKLPEPGREHRAPRLQGWEGQGTRAPASPEGPGAILLSKSSQGMDKLNHPPPRGSKQKTRRRPSPSLPTDPVCSASQISLSSSDPRLPP